MNLDVFNPQKGRIESIKVEITEKNTTWFENALRSEDIYKLTEFYGNLIVFYLDYRYPILIYDVTRKDIGYNPKKAKALVKSILEEYA